MKIPMQLSSLLPITLLLCMSGCASFTPQSGESVGVLRVSGPSVLLNNAPGRDGDPVAIGSPLATGEGSSAIVEFRDGGYLQLDENTDPIFDWLEQSKCILIRIFKGQAFLKRERACVEGPNLSMVLNSEVNLRVSAESGTSQVTLVKGKAEITAPTHATLRPGQQYTTGRTIAPALRSLSPDELKDLTAWRKDFRFRPLPIQEPIGPTIHFPVKPPRPNEPGRLSQPEPSQPEPSQPE